METEIQNTHTDTDTHKREITHKHKIINDNTGIQSTNKRQLE